MRKRKRKLQEKTVGEPLELPKVVAGNPPLLDGIVWRRKVLERCSSSELREIAYRLYRLPLEGTDRPLLLNIVTYVLQERQRFLLRGTLPTKKMLGRWQLLLGMMKERIQFLGMYDIWYPDNRNPLYLARDGLLTPEAERNLQGIRPRTPRISNS